MASTLTVDNIVGATTAGNVTLPAGYIVQAKSHAFDNTTNITSTSSFVDVTGSSFNITPRNAGNTIIISTDCYVRHDNASNNGGILRFDYGGTASSAVSAYGVYLDGGSNRYLTYSLTSIFTAGAGAATIKLQGKCYTGGNFWVNWSSGTGGNFESNITVMEIAQ